MSNQLNSPIESTIDLNIPNFTLIQHSFEISHLVAVLESMQRVAAKRRLTTSTVPDNVTHISAGERLGVGDVENGSLVREVGSITINNGKTKPNHDD